MKVLVAIIAIVIAHGSSADETWAYLINEDDFDNETNHLAVSPVVRGKPYGWFRMTLGCEEERRPKLWLTMQFGYLNLLSEIDASEYDTTLWAPIGIRYSGDQQPRTVRMNKSDDGTSLYASIRNNRRNQTAWADNLASNESVRFRFRYYGQGTVEILMPLDGAKEAVEKVIEECEFKPKRSQRN